MTEKINERQAEWSAHQRSGSVSVWLYQGSRLTTDQVARLTGLTWEGAEYMMTMLSGALPVTKINGLWQWIGKANDGEV